MDPREAVPAGRVEGAGPGASEGQSWSYRTIMRPVARPRAYSPVDRGAAFPV